MSTPGDGAYCEIKGQARFEVLGHMAEGQNIRGIHNPDVGLRSFDQVTSWETRKTFLKVRCKSDWLVLNDHILCRFPVNIITS